jgi:hypothetical protein
MLNLAQRGTHRMDCASDFRGGTFAPVRRAVSYRFVHTSVINSASSREAAGVDAAFLDEYFDYRCSPRL